MKEFKEIIESLIYCNTEQCYRCYYNTKEPPYCRYDLENDMFDLNELIEKLVKEDKNEVL